MWQYRTKLVWPLIGGLMLCLSCGRGGKQNTDIVLGEFSSLTGSTATFGQSNHNGITLAVEEANGHGGVLDRQVRVITEDDQSKPEEAKLAVLKLIKQNHVVALISDVASTRALAAAPDAQKNGVPMMCPAPTNPKVTLVGDYIFRACFIDPFQGKVMAKFALETLKAKRAAIFRDSRNDYSMGLAEFFDKSFASGGGLVVANESYAEGDIDFRAQLTAIKQTNPDFLYVPGYYNEVGLIARQARELGITCPLGGGDGWDSPKTIEIGGDALEGCFFSNHYSPEDQRPEVQGFIQRYRTRFGATPDALATLAYDATNIVLDAIGRAGSTEGKALKKALATTKDFPGVTGLITFDENRNPSKPAVILEIKNGTAHFRETVAP